MSTQNGPSHADEADGDMVSRPELIAALWPGESEGEFDRRLDKAIAKLRYCLQDKARNPSYIETLRGLGYRLRVKVTAARKGSGKEDTGTQVEAPLLFQPVPERVGPKMREVPAMPPAQRREFFRGSFDQQRSVAPAGLTLAEENRFAAPAAEMRMELLFKAVIVVDKSIELGSNALGDRCLASIVSGCFEGPMMKGEILPGTVDWQRICSDNVTKMEAHYTLKTHDGVPIRAVNRGYRHEPPDATMRLAAVEADDPAKHYFLAAPIFAAPSGGYDWMNRSLFISIAERYPDSVVIYVFEIG